MPRRSHELCRRSGTAAGMDGAGCESRRRSPSTTSPAGSAMKVDPMVCPAIRMTRDDMSMHRVSIALAIVAVGIVGPVGAQETRALPKVRVVATGGTIAGEQRDPGTLGGYEIKKSVNEIVALIPNVQRYAQ